MNKFKKRILLFIVVIIFIIIWFLISMTNNYTINPQEYPQITGNFSGQPICSNEDTGWACEFKINRSEIENMKSWEIPLVEAYKNKCEEMGGQWNCYGFCLPEYTNYCDFRYKDGGDLCISSLQCGDKCIGSFGIGKCSGYPVRFCDWYNEIFFGVPISHRVSCD